MRLYLILISFVFSFEALAFNEMTVLKELKIAPVSNLGFFYSKFDFKKGEDSCELIAVADGKNKTGVIQAGTLFNDIFVDQNECYYDLFKACKIGLSSFNESEDFTLSLTCWDKGAFPRLLDKEKINDILSGVLRIN